MALQLPRRRFTVDEYHQMAEAGILAEDDRIELIEGEIIQMAPIGREHVSIVYRLTQLFSRTCGDLALVGVQSPIHLPEDNEPEPDLVLARPRPDFYASALPGPDDIFLVIEVAGTSLPYDRQVKVRLYGRSGIPEMWLIDIGGGMITVYREPGPSGYATTQIVRRGDQIAPVAFPDRALAVTDLLG